MSNFVSWARLVLLAGVAVGTCACTASKDITEAQKTLRQVQDYRRVDMEAVSRPLSEYRKAEEDEVLFHLEHGMLEHFQQNWEQSSSHFRTAQKAIDDNFTKSINRNVQSMLVNDLQLPYRGEAYEDIYLNAVKCLNYLHRDDLEGATVEVRKVTHDLEMLSDRYKGLAESVQRDTAQAAVKKVDERLDDVDLLGGENEEDEGPIEIQQNSALGRFLTTILYAKRGQPDDARIELQKLRTALEDQGDSEFLDALSRVADEQKRPQGASGTAMGRRVTSLLLRATPEQGESIPRMEVGVNGRVVQTVDPSNMRQKAGRYSVRLADVPASAGDSVEIRPTGEQWSSLRIEVWSDSLQYRGNVGRTQEVRFALGEPDVRRGDGRIHNGRSQTTRAASGAWTDETPLEATRLTYALSRASATSTRQFTLNREFKPVVGGHAPAWQVVDETERVFGGGAAPARRDTMRLGHSSFELLRYAYHSARGGRLTVQRTEDHLVETASRWQRSRVQVREAGRVHGEGMGLELALATRSLTVGETVSLPVYVTGQRRVRTVEAHVTGADSVTTPAGRHSVYVVELQPPSAQLGTTTLYLRTAAPHHVVQAETRLPVQHEGRPDTLALRRTLTQTEELDTPDAAGAPPVASAGTGRPDRPEEAPTVAVSEESSSRPTSASAGIVPTPHQLPDADAYNTLLVSFSGRAPIKKERSFTFNFTINDEEYQLDFAIPILELSGTDVDRVRAITAGDTVRVPMIEAMQQVARAMFDEKKSIIYTRAVIRSFLKAAATKGAQKLAEKQAGAGAAWLAKQAGQFASASVAKADTRGWQTMPGFAYATVANLPAGTHEVTFEYLSADDTVLKRRTRQVKVIGSRDLALAESLYLN